MDELRDQAAELLEQAADGYESGRYYWTRNKYHRTVVGKDAYCSIGALAHERGFTHVGMARFNVHIEVATAALADHLSPGWRDKVAWTSQAHDVVTHVNDALDPKTGKRAVIEAMKHAAKDLRNG